MIFDIRRAVLPLLAVAAFAGPALAQAPAAPEVPAAAPAAPPAAAAPSVTIRITPPTPAEAAIAALVGAIDAAPGWSATYGDISAAGDAAIVNGLVIATETGPFRAEFGPVTVTGFAESGGTYSIASITVPAVKIGADTVALDLGTVALRDLAIPPFAAVTFDPTRPFTSMIRAYAVIGQIRLAEATAESLTLTQYVSGLTSVITYTDMMFAGIGNGRIETMQTGPITMTAPYTRSEVINYTIDGVSTSGFDIDAMLHVFDPDRYVNGVGDRVWRQVLAEGRYGNLRMRVPGATVSLAGFSVEDMRMRQSQQSFAPLMDRILAAPEVTPREMDQLVERHLVDMLSAFAIGRLDITGLDMTATGLDRFHLGAFHLTDLSLEGLGEMGVEDLDVVIGGEVSLQLERFAFGDLRFPAEDVLRNAMQAAVAGVEADPLSLIPLLGFVEAAGLRIAPSGEPPLTLDRASLRLDGYIGPIPTAIDLSIEGLVVPAAAAGGLAERFAGDLGYTSFTIEQRVNIFWREATETIEVNDLRFGIEDVGAVSVDFGLEGVGRAVIEHPELLADALENVTFTGATVRITDASLAERLIGLQARRANVTPEVYREQVANAIPFFIAILRNAAFQGKIAPALQQFVRTPGTLVVTMTPVAPVAFSRIVETATSAPQNLPDLLNIEVTAE